MSRIWKVYIANKAYKQLKKLPLLIQDLADEAIHDLEKEGYNPKHWDVKKIDKDDFRIRLNYRYRMRYRIINKELHIEIFYIGHRKNAY